MNEDLKKFFSNLSDPLSHKKKKQPEEETDKKISLLLI